MNEVLRHLVKKVEPVVPPEAAAAEIGGLVVADLTITATGVVSEVRIISGPESLHRAATEAVKQWTFRPFTRNGKPAPVLALVEVSFPDPKRDRELKAMGVPPWPSPAFPSVMRAVGQAQCYCPDLPEFGDAALARLIETIPASARYWFLQVTGGPGGRASSAVVYLAPARVGSDFRIGEMALTGGIGPEGRPMYGPFGSWIQLGANLGNALPPTPDRTWPIQIAWTIADGPFSVDDTVALVRAALSALPAHLRIEHVRHAGSLDAIATPSGPMDPASGLFREVRVRREGTRWVVVSPTAARRSD